ncbi:MAG: flagellar hook-basal body complex protein [Proteobacteria bacterium]|nr:flagellar hook-basal body complex protein [Pseudomonadota bacterium]
MSLARALSITSTGLSVFEKWLDVKAANLSGNGVDGFKAIYLVATDLPSEDEMLPGTPSSETGTIRPIGLQIGLGAKVVGNNRSFLKGDLVPTGRALDVAIDGDGFFKVQLPDGSSAYTRVSSLQRSGEGALVTPDGGYTISPGIKIPSDATELEINQNGQVYAKLAGQTNLQLVGQLELASFMNPSGLRTLGNGLYAETQASGTPDVGSPGTGKRGMLKSGYREGSNVNSVQEITDLIKIEKGFGFLTKVLNTAESMAEAVKNAGRG